jgi:hypothetical protein
MAAKAKADVHHRAPRCLLGLFHAAAAGLADWAEFDAEAERLSIEVLGLSRQGLGARPARGPYPAPCWESKRSGSQRPALAGIIMVSVYTIGAGGGW